MKRLFYILLLLLLSLNLSSQNYYHFANSGDDDTGDGSIGNPYASITKLNALWSAGTLAPGDSVIFKAGDTFTGTITVTESGSSGNPIIVGKYWTGDDPVITGLTTLVSWTQVGATDIYYASIDVTRLNVVTLDGDLVWMGRYPDEGYLSYESHSGNTSITDTDLTDSPDWTGAEIGIRKYRWILDRHVITDHTDAILTYNSLADWGNNNAYSPVDDNGYFFQNHLGCLDDLGDWYYDADEEKIYMHFGGGVPGSYTIQVSNTDRNATITSYDYITFDHIHFEGANQRGISITSGNYINFSDCSFTKQGGDGIYGTSADYTTMTDCSFTDILNNAIFYQTTCDNNTFTGITVINSGNILGASKSGDAAAEGIAVRGDNNTITGCSVSNIGYNGIEFRGSSFLVDNNYVYNWCSVKDDGAGIYTIGAATYTDITIRNNIVNYTNGAFAGAESYYYESFGKAAGIYLDDNSTNVTVDSNSVYRCSWAGIYLHNSFTNTVTNNNVLDCGQSQIYINYSTAGKSHDNSINHNIFIAKASTQPAFHFNAYVNENPSLSGTFDYNYYARPIDDDYVFKIYTPATGTIYKTLTEWIAYTSEDANSNNSPIAIADTAEIDFYYNFSDVSSDQAVTDMIDIEATKYAAQYTIPAYYSVTLLEDPDPDSDPPGSPVVTTTALTFNKRLTATGGGNVTDDGDGTVSARGICWSSTGVPTTSDDKTEDGTGTGAFTSTMTGLTADQIYYVRAYATNEIATSYGYVETYSTYPRIITSGGKLVTSGGKPVTVK